MGKLVEGRNGGKINQFQPGESGNPHGQPKKLFTTFNKMLQKEGYEKIGKASYIEALEIIFNTDEERLKEIAEDKKQPFMLRIMILELKDKTQRFKAMQDYRDYIFGKAKQNLGITDDEGNTVPLVLVKMPENGREKQEEEKKED